nr:putative leucine-rich repeat domain, L domain-containing protein [Ipomoea batatas]
MGKEVVILELRKENVVVSGMKGGGEASHSKLGMIKEDCTWLPRSLFVLQRHLLVCNEDLTQLGSLSENASSSYFSLDFCCAIVDVSEMVIETTESHCVTLTVEGANSEFCPSEKKDKIHEAVPKGDWKIKWFSEESLFKFVVLLKAIRTEASTSPLLVSYGQSFQV